MDIKLGAINLTKEQLTNSRALKTENIRGFGVNYETNEVTVVCLTELSPTEISNLKSSLSALPLELQPTVEETAKKGRKRQLLDALATLTGLTRKQVLKCLVELIEDRNDD